MEARAHEALPPPSEQVHLPGPSYLPALLALGATIALAGVVLAWAVFAIGMAIVAISVARWIREAREEMAELPIEHRQ